jgi:hypothetical protein
MALELSLEAEAFLSQNNISGRNRGDKMNEKVKRVGAYGILSTMLSGLFYNAYGQIQKNHIAIVRIQEREKAVKEIVIEIKKDVEFIRRKLEEAR